MVNAHRQNVRVALLSRVAVPTTLLDKASMV